jgi:glycosyltransferase involved in cell wall biosynthesis
MISWACLFRFLGLRKSSKHILPKSGFAGRYSQFGVVLPRGWGLVTAATQKAHRERAEASPTKSLRRSRMDAALRTERIVPSIVSPQYLPPALRGCRVALVHDWLTGLRGGEKCLEVLCRAFPTATLHTLLHREGSVGPTIGAMAIHTSPLQRIPGVVSHYRKLLPIMPLAARSWNVGDIDLVVSLSHCVAKSVRVPRGVPHVSYCFTPMRYAWDGREAYLQSWANRPVRRAAAGWMLDRLRHWDRTTADRVTHFVSISETIRGRIKRCYDRESVVIEPPVDTAFYTPKQIERIGPYLCVSALVPYKRIDSAIRVCTATNRLLTIIGAGPDRERLERLAGPSVTFLGWQSDEVIREHYRSCRALLFPGEEDFGIVPAEAMACGAPVIALGRGGAAETVDARAGVLYNEPTDEALEAVISGWESEGRPQDPIWARKLAERYAVPSFQERLLGHLAEVMGEGRSRKAPPAPHVGIRAKSRASES